MPKIDTIQPSEYATRCSSGVDLISQEHLFIPPLETRKIKTGATLDFNDAEKPMFEAQIRPKSSKSAEGLLVHFGTIDGDYEGELIVTMTNTTRDAKEILKGDKIAQVVLAPVARFDNVKIKDVERGTGGFGSTGKNIWVDTIRPEHYGKGTYEVINIINAWGLDFNTGNVLKYISRAGKKAGATVKQDLEKALQYAKFHKEKTQYYTGAKFASLCSSNHQYQLDQVSEALFPNNAYGQSCLFDLFYNRKDELIASLESWIASI